MAGDTYYLLASLPSIGELGSAPPIPPGELLARVSHDARLRSIVETLLLGHDLVLREAFRAGEIDDLEGLVVLTPSQARDEAPLPAYLVGPETGRRIPADDVWEAYFAHAASAGRCAFVKAWVGHEVALRNALAAARARALDLDPAEYQVAPHLAAAHEDVGSAVTEWTAAATPLAGLRTIERARWDWVAAHEAWFTFRDDEVAAYGAKLMLLDRWQRLARADSGDDGSTRRREAAGTP